MNDPMSEPNDQDYADQDERRRVRELAENILRVAEKSLPDKRAFMLGHDEAVMLARAAIH